VKRVEVTPILGLPEIQKGADLGRLIAGALRKNRFSLREGDIVVVKQKIVSKAEGRVLRVSDVRPGEKAKALARSEGKDPKLVELILKESVRVVRAGHGVIITETKHGFVCANSGIDQSNVGQGLAAMLPVDPDGSAKRIRMKLEEPGVSVAVIVTDTFGRPWRRGQTDVAIGCSGMSPLMSYAGKKDRYGYKLRVTEPAIADEVAGAAELVLGKLEGVPAAVVRGVSYVRSEEGATSMVMPKKRDLFR
jgi:coenzyme F420-0:L-glutamate ligase / coenzyme F420-1:gamma-L-glutamate ligase